MIPRCLLVALCLASLSAAIRFESRGDVNHIATPYFNSTISTRLSTSIPTVTTQTTLEIEPSYSTYIAGTTFSTDRVNSKPGPTPVDTYNATLQNYTRASSASCTVHIPDASIEWWYPPTYSHTAATLTSAWGNFSDPASLTMIPHTTSFDVASALETDYACALKWSTYTEWNYSELDCIEYTDRPTAASTSLVYQSSVPSIPSGNVIPMSETWSYDIDLAMLPSATIAISIAPNVTIIETSATPFVHFTAYEVEHGTSTETVQLSSMYVQPYWQKGIEHNTTATGRIPEGFMDLIPQSACDVGSLQAVVTVLILVNLIYWIPPELGPGIIHYESTALGWDDDNPAGVIDQDLTSLQPHIVTDWNLSETLPKPMTPASVKPGQSPNATPTTKPYGGEQSSDEPKAPHLQPSTQQTVGIIGTAPIVVGPSSVVVVGSQTLRPGGPPIIIDGTPVALAPSPTAIIVGQTTLPLPWIRNPGQQQTVGTLGSARVPPVLTIGTSTLIANAATQYFIGPGQTLTPGGTVMVDGTRVSLDLSASFIVLGSLTRTLPTSVPSSGKAINRQPQLVLWGSTFTALPTDRGSSPSQSFEPSDSQRLSQQQEQNGQINREQSGNSGPKFIISGQTLAPGGPAITVSGTVLSLASAGSLLVIDGSMTTIATPAAVAAAVVVPPPLTIGTGVFKALPGTEATYQIGTVLLVPGGSVVVAGTTISLAAGATALVINGVTTTLAYQAQPITTNPPLLTIGTRTYTAAPGSGTTFVIVGQTLTPGGTITVDGTTIVLSPQATELIYGSSGRSTSTALFPATTTRGTRTTSTARASKGQSGRNGQVAPTSTQAGEASRWGLRFDALIIVVGFMGWLLL